MCTVPAAAQALVASHSHVIQGFCIDTWSHLAILVIGSAAEESAKLTLVSLVGTG